MKKSLVTRAFRLALALMIVVVPPGVLLSLTDFPTFRDISEGLMMMQQSWQTVRHGALPGSGLIALSVIIIWLSWLRICSGFVMALVRLVVRRPLRHGQRWSTKLAFWALMISPTVVAVVVPVSVQAVSESLETTERDFQNRSLSVSQILVSVLVATGVLLRLRARRRQSLRQGVLEHSPELLAWEVAIGRENDEMAVVRLELAVRTLMRLQATSFRMILQDRNGGILVEFPHERLARPPWERHAARLWKLEAAITLEELAQFSRSQSGPIPLLLPVGHTAAGEMWVNLQEVGVFGVHGQGDDANDVWQGICQSLALSPFSEHISFISTEEQGLRGRREIVVPDEERACLIAGQLQCEEAPAVILARQRLHQGSLVAMLHRQQPMNDEFGLSHHQGRWLVHPTMTDIEPHRCTDRDLDVLDTLVLTPAVTTVAAERPTYPPSEAAGGVLPPHSFIASVLGVPHVRHVTGTAVTFERSRSEELVIWLSLHRATPRRSIARGEMWSIAIRDATFSNVTSDVRRSLTVLEQPPDGEDWLGVTLTDELPLHPKIVSDAHLLAQCFDQARRYPEVKGIEILEYGLGLVQGVPFCGSRYLWRDSTGLGSEYSMLVVRAALLLSDMYIERGDISGSTSAEGVYWATAKGLLAIPGHEDLVIRRLELHALCGDQAALCAEWQAYCRALASDDWGDVEPSEKMVEVWRRLTSMQ